jgi:methionine synthase II (cobalamin-independent)
MMITADLLRTWSERVSTLHSDAERQKRVDEERRAAIQRDVQASLDEIVHGKKKT